MAATASDDFAFDFLAASFFIGGFLDADARGRAYCLGRWRRAHGLPSGAD